FGPTLLTLSAYDLQGALVGSDTITITSTLPAPTPHDFLRITEIHYHPANPATPAELAASADKDDFEFIELQNLSTQQLNIGGCKFTAGVNVTFPLNTVLNAWDRVVVVRNVAAFQARYGTGPRIVGTYGPADSLSNSGEALTLADATGAVVQSFTYDDAWLPLTDGPGRSLVVRDESAPVSAWNTAGQWGASVTPGGTPGSSNADQIGTQYEGWRYTYFSPLDLANPAISGPLASTDGVKNALRYALGYYSPHQSVGALSSIGTDGTFLTIAYRRTKNALDATFTVEGTPDLATWTPLVNPTTTIFDNGDGTETCTVRDTVPISADTKRDLRVRVTLQP
ncbi:MAG: lamin tail domain-containing protein, partial [Chthoniobacteraceae bacterium]